MLEILILILKVIGYFLLGIVGLIFLLLALILLTPIPYRVLINGIDRDSGVCVRVRIFGIQIYPKKEKKSNEPPAAAVTEHRQQTKAGQSKQEAVKEQDKERDKKQDIKQDIKQDKKQDKKQDIKQDKSKHIKQKSQNVMEKLSLIHRELSDPCNRSALLHLLRELKRLLHYIGPRRVRGEVSFGVGDPANTGYVTAFISACPFTYGTGVDITPDFMAEEPYLQGELDVRGHVCLFHVVAVVIRLLLDSNIRTVIRKFRR